METPARVRAVAIDLFHTIVDPEDFRPRDFIRTREIAKLLGVPSNEFEPYWAADLPERTVSGTPSVTHRVKRFCSERGLSPPETVWAEVTDVLGRYADLAIRNPRKSILDSLRQLRERGFTLGIVSNCDEREVWAWSGSDLAALFDAVVFSFEVGVAKPAVETFQALVPRWGQIPLRDAIFVGDGSNDELAGARRAGFSQVIFDGEFVSQNGLRSAEASDRLRAEADRSIRRLGELVSILAR